MIELGNDPAKKLQPWILLIWFAGGASKKLVDPD